MLCSTNFTDSIMSEPRSTLARNIVFVDNMHEKEFFVAQIRGRKPLPLGVRSWRVRYSTSSLLFRLLPSRYLLVLRTHSRPLYDDLPPADNSVIK